MYSLFLDDNLREGIVKSRDLIEKNEEFYLSLYEVFNGFLRWIVQLMNKAHSIKKLPLFVDIIRVICKMVLTPTPKTQL